MYARQHLSNAASAPRVHTEGQRQVAPAGNPDGARPRDPDGDSVDFGADLRSRFRGLLLWVPSGPFGASSAGGDPGTLAARLPGGVRRGLERLFRFDSARPATSLCADASGGPEGWGGGRVGGYGEDFVVLSRYPGKRLRGWIESKLEDWLHLEINRDKTRVINLREEKASLDFLGYTFRWHRDRYGRAQRYLHVEPSKKALQRERDKLQEMTDSHQSHKPIPKLIAELNRHLKGWANYFKYGYPREAFRAINWHVGQRLFRHLNRRSQRAYRLPEKTTYYQHFQRLGLEAL